MYMDVIDLFLVNILCYRAMCIMIKTKMHKTFVFNILAIRLSKYAKMAVYLNAQRINKLVFTNNSSKLLCRSQSQNDRHRFNERQTVVARLFNDNLENSSSHNKLIPKNSFGFSSDINNASVTVHAPGAQFSPN